MYELQGDAIVRLSDNAFIPQTPGNRDYEKYRLWLQAGNSPIIPVPDFETVKFEKCEAIKEACDAALDKVYEQYPHHEAATWFKQEQEALAYTADNNANTPFLNSMAEARGVTKEEVVNRILTKAQAFSDYAGKIIGHKQAVEDQIERCTTIDELNTIDIDMREE